MKNKINNTITGTILACIIIINLFIITGTSKADLDSDIKIEFYQNNNLVPNPGMNLSGANMHSTVHADGSENINSIEDFVKQMLIETLKQKLTHLIATGKFGSMKSTFKNSYKNFLDGLENGFGVKNTIDSSALEIQCPNTLFNKIKVTFSASYKSADLLSGFGLSDPNYAPEMLPGITTALTKSDRNNSVSFTLNLDSLFSTTDNTDKIIPLVFSVTEKKPGFTRLGIMQTLTLKLTSSSSLPEPNPFPNPNPPGPTSQNSDISGMWSSNNNGLVYNLLNNGSGNYSWSFPQQNETGTITVNGDIVTAQWTKNGSPATSQGNITARNINNNPSQITFDNGLIITSSNSNPNPNPNPNPNLQNSNIAGLWNSNIPGITYNLQSSGNGIYQWANPQISETGTMTVIGDNVSAQWTNSAGPGSSPGKITKRDGNNNPSEMTFDIGIILTINNSHIPPVDKKNNNRTGDK